MVAVIHAGKSLKNILHYNEQKVSVGKAECIHSTHFGKDTELLLFKDKIGRLQKLALLNEGTKINAVHISLNFDSSGALSRNILKQIADTYMQQIGFGEQPYLVYQHHDAGHPHLHIVTTNIKGDGSRISLHNIGHNQSKKARQNIEQEFGLVRAEHQKEINKLTPQNVQKIQYGKSETKRAIANVLDAVLPHYKYASLTELNAVLKQYNVLADRGGEKSKMYKHNGLVYRILNEQGKKLGAPIKASLFSNKPTLSFLEEKFIQNYQSKQGHQSRVKNTLDFSFLKNPKQTLQTLQQELQKEQISLVIKQNKAAFIREVTYVDHKAKCVFTGSDLGKQYSANAIQQRCNGITATEPFANELKQEVKHKRQKQQHQ